MGFPIAYDTVILKKPLFFIIFGLGGKWVRWVKMFSSYNTQVVGNYCIRYECIWLSALVKKKLNKWTD